MTSHDLMNINTEEYKCRHLDAPSRSMWRLYDIMPIIDILYTHNFYTNGKPRIPAFKLHTAYKDPSIYS